MLEKRCKWESAASQANFKSGLYLSIGVLNIMLAMMPRKMEEELRKDACYGDRDLGITYLTEAMEFSGVQRKLSCLASLVAGCIISPDPGTPDHLHRKFHLQHPQVMNVACERGGFPAKEKKILAGFRNQGPRP